MRFQHAILKKTLCITQYFQYLRNICIAFKEYYGFYKQLQHLCQDSSFKEFQPVYDTSVQTEPPPDEYVIELQKQLQQPTQMLPPQDEFVSQVREQI